MRFKGLDLNLLVMLDILLDEQSVSRAAERLSLTQPAVSAALARLRDYFDDPLLVLHGKRMVPTAAALALRKELKELLGHVDILMARSRVFDPATSDRLFRVKSSDYILTVLLLDLIPRLKRVAPNVRFDLQQTSNDMIQALDRGEIDLLIAPEEHCHREHPAELLFEERYVVVGWAEARLMQEPLTEKKFLSAGHIVSSVGHVHATFTETRLQTLGRQRRLEVSVASFSMVPPLVIGTERICVVQERLARLLARQYPIALQPLPFDFPVMREMVQYHLTRESDAGIRWLRQQIRASTSE